MKKKTSLLVFIIAAVMVFSLWPQQVNAAENAARTATADNVTINNWHDAYALDDSTKNVGRIWTDKSVSAGDVTLTSREKESGTATIKKGADSDFLVGLSALSSTAKITGQTTVPLDIVLVLDVSGSMDDPMGSADRTKRIVALKKAVNNFIDKSAEANDQRTDVNKQNRIAVVKFAGNKTSKVGNDQYRQSLYSYNYTQVVSGYKAYTSGNKSEGETTVNALTPAGCTAADYAMDLTKTLVDQSKTDANNNADRKNVKRVVIFFTDGEPNHQSGFVDKVANDAIKSAQGIKADADIYTIGIFSGADVSITGHSGSGSWTNKEKFNAFMHGLSSNYPTAETYEKLGTRAKDSKGQDAAYYKVASDSKGLIKIFTQIEDEIISSAQSPTQVGQGEDPSDAGFITLTDQLGDYMQVDDINTLVYANQLYKHLDKTETTKDGKTVTYDDHSYLVYTQITDKGDGALRATHQAVSSEENDELVPAEGNTVTFNNIYKAEPATVTIEAVKKLTGKELKDGEFTFQLKDVNGKVIAEAKNDVSGKIKFENLKFEDEGTYEYTVSEVNDKQTGITYDEREFKVTVKVSNNGEGTLSAETDSDDIVFTNSYKAPKDGKTTDTPKKPDKARRGVATGDNSHMVIYLVLMIAAAAVISMVIIRRKRR